MYNHSNIESLTNDIKTKAKTLGFMSCGISKAGFLEEEAPKLEYWLNKNMNGEMSYMERNFDMRLDPTKIVEGAKSVISLTSNYYTEKTCKDSNFKISKFQFPVCCTKSWAVEIASGDPLDQFALDFVQF